MPIDPEAVERSQTLFYLLTLFLTVKSKAFKKIKSCRNKNGFEAWHLLLEEYEPRTRGRQGAILDALLVATFPAGASGLAKLEAWERELADYQDQTSDAIPRSI